MAAQQNENEMVRQELALMEETAAVYKLIGPVLVCPPWGKQTPKGGIAHNAPDGGWQGLTVLHTPCVLDCSICRGEV